MWPKHEPSAPKHANGNKKHTTAHLYLQLQTSCGNARNKKQIRIRPGTYSPAALQVNTVCPGGNPT